MWKSLAATATLTLMLIAPAYVAAQEAPGNEEGEEQHRASPA